MTNYILVATLYTCICYPITAGSYGYGQGYDYSAYGYYNQAGTTATPTTTAAPVT
jgi:hypothetical protein